MKEIFCEKKIIDIISDKVNSLFEFKDKYKDFLDKFFNELNAYLNRYKTEKNQFSENVYLKIKASISNEIINELTLFVKNNCKINLYDFFGKEINVCRRMCSSAINKSLKKSLCIYFKRNLNLKIKKYLENLIYQRIVIIFLNIPKVFKDRINVLYEYKKERFDFLWLKISANNHFYRIKKNLLRNILSLINKLELKFDKKVSVIDFMENFEIQIINCIKLYVDDYISHMDKIMYERVIEMENENVDVIENYIEYTLNSDCISYFGTEINKICGKYYCLKNESFNNNEKNSFLGKKEKVYDG